MSATAKKPRRIALAPLKIRRPWERMEEEPAVAYQAFVYFRDSPVGKRSLRRVAKALGKTEGGVIKEWSARFQWKDRADKWDLHQQRVYVREREKQQGNMAQRHARLAIQGQVNFAVLQKIFSKRLLTDPSLQAELNKMPAIELVKILRTAANGLNVLTGIERTANGLAKEKIELETTDKVRAVQEVEELMKKRPDVIEAFEYLLDED